MSRKRIMERWAALKSERSTWDSHWGECADYYLPRRRRSNKGERNQGTKRNDKIINATPVIAARTLATGLFTALTSPARMWFRYGVPDDELLEAPGVRDWLFKATRAALSIARRSNYYQSQATFNEDLVVFNTAVMLRDNHPVHGLRFYPIPNGTYALANGPDGMVDTLYRELSMTVAQLVERFGTDAVSERVRGLYENAKYDQWIDVLHVIEPNRERNPDRADRTGMPWRSCWVEQSANDDKYLRESGYDKFPVIAARWSVTGEDVYGRGPSMDALGDAKALQTLEKKKLRGVGKLIDPPMNVPPELKDSASLAEGAINVVKSQGIKAEPSMAISTGGLQAVELTIREHEQRINDAMYASLWLMLNVREGDQPLTAEETRAREAEKRLQLGALVSRFSDEVLDPVCDALFDAAWGAGLIPPPPDAIRGVPMTLEKFNQIEQAQRAQDLAGVRELLQTALAIAPITGEMDKLNTDQIYDLIAQTLDTPPSALKTDEEVAAIRQQRAQAQATEAAAKAAAEASKAAAALGQTPMGQGSALDAMLEGVQA